MAACSALVTSGTVVVIDLVVSIVALFLMAYFYASARALQRRADQEGAVSSRMVLPVYSKVLSAYLVASGISVINNACESGFFFKVFGGSVASWLSAPSELLYCLCKASSFSLLRALQDGVALFFCHKGAGMQTALRCLAATVVWYIIFFVSMFMFVLYQRSDGNPDDFWLVYPGWCVWCAEMGFFLYHVLKPFNRPAAATYIRTQCALVVMSDLPRLLIVALDQCGPFKVLGSRSAETAIYIAAFATISANALVGPWILTETLRKDSMYWQGEFFECFTSVTSDDDALVAPLIGSTLPAGPAVELADTVEQIALARGGSKKQPLLIHFGRVRVMECVGQGGFAKVYKAELSQGLFQKVPVAVKVMWCCEVSVEAIQLWHKEVLSLKALSTHRNVVQMHGISIMPPSLGIVMEYCALGSLRANLTAAAAMGSDPGEEDEEQGAGVLRRVQRLAVRVDFAAQCARAVAHLHGQVPWSVVHMDIKSENFLLAYDGGGDGGGGGGGGDGEGSGGGGGGIVVKLSDLGSSIIEESHLTTAPAARQSEGWESTMLGMMTGGRTRAESGRVSHFYSSAPGLSFVSDEAEIADLPNEETLAHGSGLGPPSSSSSSPSSSAPAHSTMRTVSLDCVTRTRTASSSRLLLGTQTLPTVSDYVFGRSKAGTGMTTDQRLRQRFPGLTMPGITLQWAAPEIIRGDVSYCSTRTDVYSLGVVFYEIFTFQYPYDNVTNLGDLAERICSRRSNLGVGRSSAIDDLALPPDKDIPGHLRDLVAQMTHHSPGRRPTAQDAHDILYLET